MRLVVLAALTATLMSPDSPSAPSLIGVWRLVEVNSLPMQETPPYGQINRKEVYTPTGKVLVARPDVAFAEANSLGTYEVHDGVRLFTGTDGTKTETEIHWIDDDHFYFEFNPRERWYYARVVGTNAEEQQWEPRSVAVIRVEERAAGPTLRDFVFDLTDDSAMPWNQRVLGAWETIKVAGRAVSGPDTPPYGMPNDRILVSANGTMRKVHANNEADRDGEAVRIKIEANKITIVDAGMDLYFWFNRWGQLILEDQGMQTVLKRITMDAAKAPPGPFVVVLLASEREQPPAGGKIVEVKKSASPSVPATSRSGAATASPRPTFKTPYNGRSYPADLALDDTDASLKASDPVNRASATLGASAPVVDVQLSEKFAVVRANALAATFEVPLGWHVVDNGKRTLVFDADHFVEVQLDRRAAKSGAKALLQSILNEQHARQADLKSQLTENPDGSVFLMMPNYKEGNEAKPRAYISRSVKEESGSVLVAQISAGAADLIRALNLTEVVLRHLKDSGK